MLKKMMRKIVKPEIVPAGQAPGAFVEHFDKQESFFIAVRKAFGPLRQGQVDGFNSIFGEWYLRGTNDMRWLAYMFATAWHETAATMQPITEYGGQKYLRSKKYWPYIGRGYVQLTWKANYEKYGIADKPEMALDPATAAHIMFDGMFNGVFTGKKLSDYFNDHVTDPINARRIINGTDKAQLIAQHYQHFLFALNADPVRPKVT